MIDTPANREGLYLPWLARVERRLIRASGCEVAEFCEFNFRARYAAKVTPAEVVAELLEGFEDCLSSVDHSGG
jgi:hypothetical protein